MTDRTLKKTIFLKAAREQVWDYLTRPELLARWFHAPAAPLSAGERYEMIGATSGTPVIWGEVKEARAPEYLEYTFTVQPMGDAVSLVKWWLEAVPGGTMLSLEHSGLDASEEAFGLTAALDQGWDKHFQQMRDALNPSE